MVVTSGVAVPDTLRDSFDKAAFSGPKSTYAYSVGHDASSYFSEFRNTNGS